MGVGVAFGGCVVDGLAAYPAWGVFCLALGFELCACLFVGACVVAAAVGGHGGLLSGVVKALNVVLRAFDTVASYSVMRSVCVLSLGYGV